MAGETPRVTPSTTPGVSSGDTSMEKQDASSKKRTEVRTTASGASEMHKQDGRSPSEEVESVETIDRGKADGGAGGGDPSTNCKVLVRVRPLNQIERLTNQGYCVQWETSKGQLNIESVGKSFPFEYCFGPQATQQEVYEAASCELIDQFFKGYNCSVLAYGQTGSGKTHTMGSAKHISQMGSDYGIIPRAARKIFADLEKLNIEKHTEIAVTFLEIYNEEFRDLLDPESFSGTRKGLSNKVLKISEDPVTHQIAVIGSKNVILDTEAEMMDCLHRGGVCRMTAPNILNTNSSRSHAIFTVTLTQKAKHPASPDGAEGEATADRDKTAGGAGGGGSDDYMQSKFHFVDLAGSERTKRTKAEGDRLKEGISINGGLLALGNVINALTEERQPGSPPPHIPYRDSKLTRLLQDSLGGNSKTLMIACISGAQDDFAETYNTIKYASRARKIQNIPIINRDPTSTLIESLRLQVHEGSAQILTLRRQLAAAKGGGGSVSSGEGVASQEEMFKIYSSVYKGSMGLTMNQLESQLKAVEKDLSAVKGRASNLTAYAADIDGQLRALTDYLKENNIAIPDEQVRTTATQMVNKEKAVDVVDLKMELEEVKKALESERKKKALLQSRVSTKGGTSSLLTVAAGRRSTVLLSSTETHSTGKGQGGGTAGTARSSVSSPTSKEHEGSCTRNKSDRGEGSDDDEDDEVEGDEVDDACDILGEQLGVSKAHITESLELRESDIGAIVNAPDEERYAVLDVLGGVMDEVVEGEVLKEEFAQLEKSIGQTDKLLQGAENESARWECMFQEMAVQIAELQKALMASETQRDNLRLTMHNSKGKEKDKKKTAEIEVNLEKQNRWVDAYKKEINNLSKERDRIAKKKIETETLVATLKNQLTSMKQDKVSTQKKMQEQEKRHKEIVQRKEVVITHLTRQGHKDKTAARKRETADRQRYITIQRKNEELARKVKVMEFLQTRRVAARTSKSRRIKSNRHRWLLAQLETTSGDQTRASSGHYTNSPMPDKMVRSPGGPSTTSGVKGRSGHTPGCSPMGIVVTHGSPDALSLSSSTSAAVAQAAAATSSSSTVDPHILDTLQEWVHCCVERKVMIKHVIDNKKMKQVQLNEKRGELDEMRSRCAAVEGEMSMKRDPMHTDMLRRQLTKMEDLADTLEGESRVLIGEIDSLEKTVKQYKLSDENLILHCAGHMDVLTQVFVDELIRAMSAEADARRDAAEVYAELQDIQKNHHDLQQQHAALTRENRMSAMEIMHQCNSDKLELMDYLMARSRASVTASSGKAQNDPSPPHEARITKPGLLELEFEEVDGVQRMSAKGAGGKYGGPSPAHLPPLPHGSQQTKTPDRVSKKPVRPMTTEGGKSSTLGQRHAKRSATSSSLEGAAKAAQRGCKADHKGDMSRFQPPRACRSRSQMGIALASSSPARSGSRSKPGLPPVSRTRQNSTGGDEIGPHTNYLTSEEQHTPKDAPDGDALKSAENLATGVAATGAVEESKFLFLELDKEGNDEGLDGDGPNDDAGGLSPVTVTTPTPLRPSSKSRPTVVPALGTGTMSKAKKGDSDEPIVLDVKSARSTHSTPRDEIDLTRALSVEVISTPQKRSMSTTTSHGANRLRGEEVIDVEAKGERDDKDVRIVLDTPTTAGREVDEDEVFTRELSELSGGAVLNRALELRQHTAYQSLRIELHRERITQLECANGRITEEAQQLKESLKERDDEIESLRLQLAEMKCYGVASSTGTPRLTSQSHRASSGYGNATDRLRQSMGQPSPPHFPTHHPALSPRPNSARYTMLSNDRMSVKSQTNVDPHDGPLPPIRDLLPWAHSGEPTSPNSSSSHPSVSVSLPPRETEDSTCGTARSPIKPAELFNAPLNSLRPTSVCESPRSRPASLYSEPRETTIEAMAPPPPSGSPSVRPPQVPLIDTLSSLESVPNLTQSHASLRVSPPAMIQSGDDDFCDVVDDSDDPLSPRASSVGHIGSVRGSSRSGSVRSVESDAGLMSVMRSLSRKNDRMIDEKGISEVIDVSVGVTHTTSDVEEVKGVGSMEGNDENKVEDMNVAHEVREVSDGKEVDVHPTFINPSEPDSTALNSTMPSHVLELGVANGDENQGLPPISSGRQRTDSVEFSSPINQEVEE
eukprot:GHVN01034038.1.p1 GENE.GHVN01034038.1~~GHVN01034038.1.p1  ORF type:complete len:2126 (+),score=489.80 GHVN01034038.1:3064-9441(+)